MAASGSQLRCGARLRVALTALTMAEYYRDQGMDVLLFIDNIFRFVQAGSEFSALLGRMPSAVGYQRTLGTEMSALQAYHVHHHPAPSPACRRSTYRPTTSSHVAHACCIALYIA